MNPHVRILTEALTPEYGTRARALAEAADRYCSHHNRARFQAEVRAIKTCVLIDFGEYRERSNG